MISHWISLSLFHHSINIQVLILVILAALGDLSWIKCRRSWSSFGEARIFEQIDSNLGSVRDTITRASAIGLYHFPLPASRPFMVCAENFTTWRRRRHIEVGVITSRTEGTSIKLLQTRFDLLFSLGLTGSA